MLAQYLVSLRVANSQKSKIRSVKAVNFAQVNKERTYCVNLLVKSLCIVFQKYILRQGCRPRFVLNLFLIFDQISGWCSYEIVLMKRRAYIITGALGSRKGWRQQS